MFRQKKNKVEAEARTINNLRHSKQEQSFMRELTDQASEQKITRAQWESFSVWEKGLLLREQCERWLGKA